MLQDDFPFPGPYFDMNQPFIFQGVFFHHLPSSKGLGFRELLGQFAGDHPRLFFKVGPETQAEHGPYFTPGVLSTKKSDVFHRGVLPGIKSVG